MTNEELKQAFTNLVPAITFDESGEFLNAFIPSSDLIPFITALRKDSSLQFDYLFCLTCIDWKDHLMMVYHLLSKQHKHTLVLKVKLTDRNHAEIESLCHVYRTAEFHEREVFDLFGVRFLNHPDLRRLFLDDNWPGHPLLKDYVDENMIEI